MGDTNRQAGLISRGCKSLQKNANFCKNLQKNGHFLQNIAKFYKFLPPFLRPFGAILASIWPVCFRKNYFSEIWGVS
jgi:hypothetical protein